MPSATVRLLCEARSPSRSVPDAATGLRPFYWRGSSLAFQLALTDQGTHLLAAGVGTIIVEVKRLSALPIDDSLLRKEFVQADCDETFSAADWPAGTKALLTAAFTVNEAAILPGVYRLIVRHIAEDDTELVHLSTELQVLEPQSGSTGIDPPPGAWSFMDEWPVVRHDIDQGLTNEEQAQARKNIAATAPPLILTEPPEDGALTGMTVDAPNSVFDGFYPINGTANGKTQFTKADNSRHLRYGGPGWQLDSETGTIDLTVYNAADGSEPSPELAVNWVTSTGHIPVTVTISPTYGGGTVGEIDQFAILGDRIWKCISIAPFRWLEMLPAIDLNGTDTAGITAPLLDGKRHLALFNTTLNGHRGFRLTGNPATSTETWETYDLPV